MLSNENQEYYVKSSLESFVTPPLLAALTSCPWNWLIGSLTHFFLKSSSRNASNASGALGQNSFCQANWVHRMRQNLSNTYNKNIVRQCFVHVSYVWSVYLKLFDGLTLKIQMSNNWTVLSNCTRVVKCMNNSPLYRQCMSNYLMVGHFMFNHLSFESVCPTFQWSDSVCQTVRWLDSIFLTVQALFWKYTTFLWLDFNIDACDCRTVFGQTIQ